MDETEEQTADERSTMDQWPTPIMEHLGRKDAPMAYVPVPIELYKALTATARRAEAAWPHIDAMADYFDKHRHVPPALALAELWGALAALRASGFK